MKRLSIKLMLFAALLFEGCNHIDEHLPTRQTRPGDEICRIEVCADVVDQISYSSIPIESRFMIRGYYGCVVAIPYSLVVCQKGIDITYFFNDDEEYVLDYDQFKKFWQLCSSIDLNQLKSSYGSMRTTADFRGHLTIQCRSEKGGFLRKVEFQRGVIKDRKFEKLINAMMKMVSKRHRLPEWLVR